MYLKNVLPELINYIIYLMFDLVAVELEYLSTERVLYR